MSFKQLVHILWARRRTFLLVAMLLPGVVLGICLLMPKEYRAVVSLMLDFKGTDPVSDRPSVMLLPTVLVATETDLIKSHHVGVRVVEMLHLDESPTVRAQFESQHGTGTVKDWLADVLIRHVDVEPSRDSSVLKIRFDGAEPQFAATVANAFADAYIKANIDLKAQFAKQSASWYDDQLKVLRERLEVAQGKLSKYQREKGIVSTDERVDVETARLNELSNQLASAQAQTYEASSRQVMAQAVQAGGQGLESAPEVVSNSLVQNLKIELARQDAKLSEIASRLGPQHPQYERARAERDEVYGKLQREIGTVARSLSSSAGMSKRREEELRAAFSRQKERVMSLKAQRDEITVLTRDVETAQRVYDNAVLRGDQQRLESRSSLTNVTILNPALAPARSSSPATLLFTLLAALLAPFAATAAALAMEALDRRVRSGEDLTRSLGVPLIGSIGRSSPTRMGRALGWIRRKGARIGRGRVAEPTMEVPVDAVITVGR